MKAVSWLHTVVHAVVRTVVHGAVHPVVHAVMRTALLFLVVVVTYTLCITCTWNTPTGSDAAWSQNFPKVESCQNYCRQLRCLCSTVHTGGIIYVRSQIEVRSEDVDVSS